MRILVTGGTGYVGAGVVRTALMRGWSVTVASRSRLLRPDVDWTPFNLEDSQFVLPEDIDVVVHLAAQTDAGAAPDEVSCARNLLAQCAHRGIRMVFISSQAAAANAPTAYGRTKWAIEQLCLAEKAAIIRLGQVYGGSELGLFGTLCDLVRKNRVLPRFVPEPRVQPIHVEEAATGVLNACEISSTGQIWCLGDPDPVRFAEFLRAIARARQLRTPLFIPLPSELVRLGASLLPRVTALTRLTSLLELKPMATETSLAALNLSLRSLDEGLKETRRRGLLREAFVLYSYLGTARPPIGPVKRYVRAIERLRQGRALSDMTGLPLKDLLRLPRGAIPEYDWRLDAATQLLEASVAGARLFLQDKPVSLVIAVVSLASAVAREGAARASGLLRRISTRASNG